MEFAAIRIFLRVPITTINAAELRPGLFVRLDLPWHKHPFMFNQFMIRDARQIEQLRKLGMAEIGIDTNRSDPEALRALADDEPPPPDPRPEIDPELWAAKQRRIAQVRRIRHSIQQCEKRFAQSSANLKQILGQLQSQPAAAVEEADKLVSEMAVMLREQEQVVVNLVNSRLGDDDSYHHALNVMSLSMLLGRAARRSVDELHALGLGALFHDVGKLRLPDKVRRPQTKLSAAEQALADEHPKLGAALMRRIGSLPKRSVAVIEQHHERMDGGGFPMGLAGSQIDVLARICHIANHYDNLCNPLDRRDALPPAQALAQMFKRGRAVYDEHLLRLFVKEMGVYPPGSLVRLNSGELGVVISINQEHGLHPTVLLHDAHSPRQEAPLVDLREADDVRVVEAVAPESLSAEVLDYLCPHHRLNFFIQPGTGKDKA